MQMCQNLAMMLLSYLPTNNIFQGQYHIIAKIIWNFSTFFSTFAIKHVSLNT